RQNASVESIGRDDSCLPLGIVPDQEFRSSRHRLEPGESLVAYTDGVTGAMSDQRDTCGHRRLEACIARSTGDIDSTVKSIINEVEAYVGENSFRDDTCIVGFQRAAE